MTDHLISDNLFAWIVIGVIVGFVFPQLDNLVFLSPYILIIMIGSISLTLSFHHFKDIQIPALISVLIIQLILPILAYLLAILFTLTLEMTIGFVFLAAVTPELVSPVLTKLAGGNTAFTTTVLVLTGLLIVISIPLYLTLFFSMSIEVDLNSVIIDIIKLVITPMVIAIILRTYFEQTIAKYDENYPEISALMIIAIITIVSASNKDDIMSNFNVLPKIVVAVFLFNILSYLLGYGAGRLFSNGVNISFIFIVGMRDFAVAIALILSSGLDSFVAIPAVLFGIIEMITSSIIVKKINWNKNQSEE